MRMTIGAWIFIGLLASPFYFLILVGAAKLAGIGGCE